MFLRHLFSRFSFTMARRDARRSLLRLLASGATIALGIAVLVSVGSLSEEVSDSVHRESKALLGADLSIRARTAFSDEVEAKFSEILSHTDRSLSKQISLATVASFQKGQAVRLCRVRAIDGEYPFYGEIDTEPKSAASAFARGEGALVETSLLEFGKVAIGDTIKIGTREIPIVGALLKIPGESATAALLGARVYIPLSMLDSSLLARGSSVDYAAFFRLGPRDDADAIENALRPFTSTRDLRVETARSVEASWSRASDRLHDFLHLAALAALLLGGLGVGSAMQLHARRKREIVATMRCLGASSDRAFAVFALQAILLGAFGTLIGALLGIGVHLALPKLFNDFLPVQLEGKLSLVAIATGCTVGILFALIAAAWPLLALRSIPPLLALRPGFESQAKSRTRRRATSVGFFLLLLLVIAGFSILETGRIRESLYYAAALGIVFLCLGVAGRVVVLLARSIARLALPFSWRFAIASLQRPDNQTPVLLLTLGLGAFLLATIDQTEAQLYSTIDRATSGVQPNLVLFDVQSDQADDVRAILKNHDAPLLDDVPVITMRIAKLKGRTVAEMRQKNTPMNSPWALSREYRSTVRDHLADTEETVEGEWKPATAASHDPATPAPISLEKDIALRLDVGVGDSITWDVAGVPVETTVAHLRRVDWQRLRPNFFAVFPPGVLDDAPQFRILSTRVDDPNQLGVVQREIANAHPGISAIDVRLILEVANQLLDRIGLVLRAMGWVCIAAGGLVLLGAWLGTRRERIAESALLRSLGARSALVRKMSAIEAGAIGIFATIAGSSLAVLAAYALARYRFEVPFELAAGRLAMLTLGIALYGLVIAMLAGRGIHDAPPLEVLREE